VIKTFPLKMESGFHKAIEEAAHADRKSLHQWILDTLALKIAAKMNGGK
jgi:predicted HicB family RNase H-like nuclease